MAHSNPEFALGLQHRDTTPVTQQVRDEPTFGDLRSRIRYIEYRVAAELPLSLDERTAWQAWCAGRRQIRQRQRMDAACPSGLAGPRAGGMHAGGKAGEVFVPPVRRGEGRRRPFALT